MRYVIENAEEISRFLPGGLEIPPVHIREALRPGDLATLLFSLEGRAPGEPLEVVVVDVAGPGHYFGHLLDPSGDLYYGMPVEFDKRQIAWVEAAPHYGLSGLFDVYKPKSEGEPEPETEPPPPLQPPPGRGVFLPEPEPEFESRPTPAGYNLPAYPRELERIPLDPYPLPDVFYLPYGPQPGGLVPAEETSLTEFRREAPPPAPASSVIPAAPTAPANPFAIYSKPSHELAPIEKPSSAFSVFTKQPKTLEQIQAEAGPMAIFTPAPSQAPIPAPLFPQEPSPLDIYSPAAMELETERLKQMPLWAAIIPEEEHGAMYKPEIDPFEVNPFEPEPLPGAPEGMVQRELEEQKREAKKSSKRAARKRMHDWSDFEWEAPSPQWMAKRLGEVFGLKKLWNRIRKDRLDEDWRERQMEEEGMEYGNPIPIQTVVNYEMGGGETLIDGILSMFDIDTTELQPLLDAAEKELEEEEEGSANDRLSEISQDLRNLIYEGFDLIKPDDLPGTFAIYDDPNMFGNQEFIGYAEDPEDTLTPQEINQRRAEAEYLEQKEQERQEKHLKKLLGTWRPMTWEQAAEFLDVNFGIQELAKRIRKGKKSLLWKTMMAENGQGVAIIENFGIDDGTLELRVAEFLGVPRNVVDRFAEDQQWETLWDFVFHPSFEAISDAWENVKPKDLPGLLEANADEQDEFLLYYGEGEEMGPEGEESEEAEEGEE